MPDLFTNTTFYASADPTTGYRIPVALNFEDPENPDGGGGVENPDPGGPGGGTGGGGDIGNIDGSGTTTIGNAPSITRKTHSQDIFVASSSTMSITYVAASACTWVPKRPRADMTVSFTDDGLEMTITWPVPANERGDSTYIGAEAWVYGGDDQEAVTQIWDRLHINKVAGDIKTIGVGTSYPLLQPGIERTDVNAGDTIVINDSTYSDYYDVLNIGYWQDGSNGAINTQTPNGVSDGVDTVDVIGSDGITVTGTEDIVSITKFTTIMAATPLGAILDRNDFYHASRMYGNYRPGERNGFRAIHGIKIKGIAIRHALSEFSIEHADSCAYEFCHHVSDSNPEDVETKHGEVWRNGDGGQFNATSARNCYFDACWSIGNDRFGLIIGSGTTYGSSGTKHTTFRRMGHTMACLQPNTQSITQDYTIYGGRSVELLNCIAVDGALFKDGYRAPYSNQSAGPEELRVAEHSAFIATNYTGDDIYYEGIMSLNSTTCGYRCKTDALSIQSTVKNSVFWDKKYGFNSNAMSNAFDTDMINVTLGKNEDVFQGVSCIYDYDGVSYQGSLLLSGSWDYSYTSENVNAGGYPSAADVNFGFVPESFGDGSYIASLGTNESTSIEASNAKISGAHYIGYTAPGSTLRENNIGCPDIFATVGTGGNLKLDADLTRYDGLGANQMVNWLAEIPWIEIRRERQAYSCVANGQTFTGNVGISRDGINPTDYLNRFGTTPAHPLNAPMISDIYGKALGSGSVTIWWRPVCAAYRSSITGYHLYIDGIKVTPAGEQEPKESTSFTFTSVNTGTRDFQVVVVDPINGNSGLSRPATVVVA